MLAVLGMHSGGTSVATGMLQDQGVDFGDVEDEPTWMQAKGTREHLGLYRLGLDLLRYNGASWRRPPLGGPLRWTAEHVARRNEILSTYTRSPCGFKDPNTLVLLDFWRDVPLQFIGVIRNPLSTARSMVWRERRARRKLGDRIWYLRRRQWQLSFRGSLRLWKLLNRRLLEELRRSEFPVINFDDGARLGDQVRAALAFYGIAAERPFSFFEPGIVKHDLPDWREALGDREAAAMWDELVAHAARLDASVPR